MGVRGLRALEESRVAAETQQCARTDSATRSRARAAAGFARDQSGNSDRGRTSAGGPIAASMLALQSAVGNAALSHMIQRDPEGPTKTAAPDWDPHGPRNVSRPHVSRDPEVRDWKVNVH